jgi:hypothetical protein
VALPAYILTTPTGSVSGPLAAPMTRMRRPLVCVQTRVPTDTGPIVLSGVMSSGSLSPSRRMRSGPIAVTVAQRQTSGATYFWGMRSSRFSHDSSHLHGRLGLSFGLRLGQDGVRDRGFSQHEASFSEAVLDHADGGAQRAERESAVEDPPDRVLLTHPRSDRERSSVFVRPDLSSFEQGGPP